MKRALLIAAIATLVATPALADAPAVRVPVHGAARPKPIRPVAVRPVSIPMLLDPAPDSARDSLPSAGQVQPWWDGAVYRMVTAPERVGDIALQPGEALIAVAAGDTARWVIGDTASGSGSSRRTHILVKPAASPLRTNLVITTDRRVYHLELETGARPMTSLSWTYPEDELLALQKQDAALAAAEPVAAPVAIERLNFNYAIEGDTPPWRPLRAFDDGRQTFIEFPPALGSGEAPPLFVIGPSGKAELVNYRQKGLYYVVDRLFGAAELRLGERRQQVVRITRANSGGRKGGRSR